MKKRIPAVALLAALLSIAAPLSRPAPKLKISSSPVLPSARVGSPYATTISARGGILPYRWTLRSGRMPAGLALQSNGAIQGTPTMAGSSSFAIQVMDSGSQATSQSFFLSVSPASGPSISSISPSIVVAPSMPNVMIAGANFQPGASVSIGGVAAAVNSVSSTSISATPGNPSGSPICSPVDVVVTNPDGQSATLPAAFQFKQPVQISTAGMTFDSANNNWHLPPAVVGQPYSFQLVATGGCPPYTWSIVSGSLPPGMILAKNGVMHITPTAAQTRFSFAGKNFVLDARAKADKTGGAR